MTAPELYNRITVKLVPPASQALNQAMTLTGLNKTDVVNRALQLYAYLEQAMSDGGDVLVQMPDKIPQALKLM